MDRTVRAEREGAGRERMGVPRTRAPELLENNPVKAHEISTETETRKTSGIAYTLRLYARDHTASWTYFSLSICKPVFSAPFARGLCSLFMAYFLVHIFTGKVRLSEK